MDALVFVAAGIASWFGSPGHTCAMNLLPRGAEVVIVAEDHREARCTIVGSGPCVRGRIIDVSPTVARELGFYSSGLASVRVYREVIVHARKAEPPLYCVRRAHWRCSRGGQGHLRPTVSSRALSRDRGRPRARRD